MDQLIDHEDQQDQYTLGSADSSLAIDASDETAEQTEPVPEEGQSFLDEDFDLTNEDIDIKIIEANFKLLQSKLAFIEREKKLLRRRRHPESVDTLEQSLGYSTEM